MGTRSAATEILQTQGDFQQTGNSLDVAIQGLGYFQVLTPNGQTAYTRGGSFHLDSQGNVVTSDGDALQPAITIPANATAITIGADGTVTVTIPNQTQSQQIGQIQLATFPNPGGLNSIGANLLLPTSSSGDPIVGTPGGTEGMGTLVQGSLEQSNVNTVEEFIQMILAQRSYEANSQVAKAADQMFQEVNQLGK
jgi:flagellar basal-body rod protein FlgG